MSKTTFSGNSIDSAVKAAASHLGVDPSEVSYDVMAGHNGGFALIKLKAGGAAVAMKESLSGSTDAPSASEGRPRRDDRGGRGRGRDDRGGRGGRGRRDDRGGDRGGRGRRGGRSRAYELPPVPEDGPTEVTMQLGEGVSLSEVGEDAHEVMRDILTGMGFGATVVMEEKDDSIWFDIQTEAYADALTGNAMELLDAIEHLLDKVVNFDADDRKKILVDANGAKKKADLDLTRSAQELAETALAEGKTMKIGPLDPRSRRVVHMALTDVKGVSTRSEGEGVYRRVCIIPRKQKQSD